MYIRLIVENDDKSIDKTVQCGTVTFGHDPKNKSKMIATFSGMVPEKDGDPLPSETVRFPKKGTKLVRLQTKDGWM